MWSLLGGLFLGWGLGANNASNVFGTAVASRAITFRNAAILCAGFVLLGAVLQGDRGIQTLSGLTDQTLPTLVITSVSAAITAAIMTVLRLPISTSQGMVGAIAGIGLATGSMNWAGLEKVAVCWLATPIGALIISCLLYKIIGVMLMRLPMSMLTRDKVLWGTLLVMGVYGSYALGANNVANATGIFSGHLGLSDRYLAFLGGIAIAVGVVTYSRRVMLAVGSQILRLDAFTAVVAVTAMSVTVHVFAIIGVPVSTSQGIVGAILGIALMRGTRDIGVSYLRNIAFGWLLTPAVSLILAAAGYAICCSPHR